MIREDKKGFLWVATGSGLNYFNTQTGKFIHYLHNENNPHSIAYNDVRIIYKDREGTTWFGAGSPFSPGGGEINKGGLMRYNPQTDNFTNYLHNSNDPKTLIDNHVTAIFEDSRDTFWVGTMGDGLHTMNRTNGTFERHTYEKAHPDKLSRPPLRNIFPYCKDFISFINEDACRKIWIGTFSGGIRLYDSETKKITSIDVYNDTTGTLKDFSYFTSFISRDSIFWLASWLGELYTIDPFLNKIPYTSINEFLKGAIKESQKTLWIYGDSGLIEKNLRTSIQKKFIHDAKLPNSLSHNNIRCIVTNKNHKWWIATYGGGLDYFDPVAESFIHYKHDAQNINTVSSDSIDVVYINGDSLWIGTRRGLDVMNLTTGKFSHFLHNAEDPDNLQNSTVREIYAKDNETVWLGMGDPRGMNVLDMKGGLIHQQYYLAGDDISDIFKDHRGTLWVTTGEGLFRYDTSVKIFSRFLDPNRLTKFGATINIQEDDKKNLWILTHSSIYKIDSNRGLITTYGSEYGVQNSDWNAANKFINVSNDEIFLIDNKGYFSFKPTDIKNNPIPPQILINDFQITGDSLNNGSGKKEILANQRELVLTHKQNTFSIEFLPIHFGNPAKNKIIFKLDNIDADWREPGNERKAYYFNLPSGTYTFHLKACNYTGALSERQLIITISPPWWLTWWAYLLYILVFFVALWSFIKWRERTLKKEKDLLEEKVEMQNAVMNERLRISRELHDDIGSTLGSISIYSEVAKNRNEKNENTTEVIAKIGSASRELIDKMSDIVWSMNPNNESFEQLQNRMQVFAAIMLTPHEILFNIYTEKEVKDLKLTAEERRNIYLIYKEAIHNIIKYAKCTRVEIILFSNTDEFVMSIKDSGKGFDMNNGKQTSESLGGNGIKNMHARAESINAEFKIQSIINTGTTIVLKLKV